MAEVVRMCGSALDHHVHTYRPIRDGILPMKGQYRLLNEC
jgi:hypothetical protein